MAKYEMAQQNGRSIDGEDMIFGINRRAAEMIAEKGKGAVINSAIGALMDDNGDLMVLSSVDATFKSLTCVEYAAYAPICGLPEFREAAVKAAFKNFTPKRSHVRAVATPGGTGALRNVISNYSCRGDKLLTTDWHWAPYKTIADEQGRSFETFKLFDGAKKFNADDLERAAKAILAEQDQLIIFLNTPAQNPTGYSLTNEDWQKVVELVSGLPKEKKITLLIDTAYIDFAGDEEEYRSFLPCLEHMPENVLAVLAFSMSKTFTLYGMRCGAIICLAPTKSIADEFVRVCEFSSRAGWSTAPKAGQSMIVKIFSDNNLLEKVTAERKEIREMLLRRAKAFEEEAQKTELEMLPYDGGFFISIPCEDPKKAATELEKYGIFIVPLAMGLRVSVASVSEKNCRKMPAKIAEVLKQQ